MKERPTQAAMFSKTQAVIAKNAISKELEADTFLDLLFRDIEHAAGVELTSFCCQNTNIPKLALDQLRALGYTVTKNDNGYLISWDKPAMVNRGISIPELPNQRNVPEGWEEFGAKQEDTIPKPGYDKYGPKF